MTALREQRATTYGGRRQASAALGDFMVCSAIHAWAWFLSTNHGDHRLVPSARVISTMNRPVLRKIL
jgi:hypothetical protein